MRAGATCDPRVPGAHLQRDDLLVALVEALREQDHDVALLEQQLLVAVDLRLLLLDRLALLLELCEPRLVLGADALLVLLERVAEGGDLLQVADVEARGAAHEDLGLQHRDALLEVLLLLLLAHELARPGLERADGGHLTKGGGDTERVASHTKRSATPCCCFRRRPSPASPCPPLPAAAAPRARAAAAGRRRCGCAPRAARAAS